jgi:hypothetical protein
VTVTDTADHRDHRALRRRACQRAAGSGTALCAAQEDLPQARQRLVPQVQVAGDARHARHLLHHALAALGPRPVCARPGGARRSRQPALLLLLHRDLAAGILLRRRLLVMAGIGLFLVTSTVGRAWCGYACPQTVWVDLFLVGRARHRGRPQRPHQARNKAPWSADKIVKRSASTHLAADRRGDRRRLDLLFRRRADAARRCRDRQAPPSPITIAMLTATTYTFGGLMREQVCTYMCPWPRIQAAMLDEHSLTVTYNDWRGEPRSRHAKKASPRASRSATASTAMPASRSARWASTSATASSSNASPARCASTPATT